MVIPFNFLLEKIKKNYKADIEALKNDPANKDLEEQDILGGVALKELTSKVQGLLEEYFYTMGWETTSYTSAYVALEVIKANLAAYLLTEEEHAQADLVANEYCNSILFGDSSK